MWATFNQLQAHEASKKRNALRKVERENQSKNPLNNLIVMSFIQVKSKLYINNMLIYKCYQQLEENEKPI
jgi:hypothetical protein